LQDQHGEGNLDRQRPQPLPGAQQRLPALKATELAARRLDLRGRDAKRLRRQQRQHQAADQAEQGQQADADGL
jgi:hypothetical protein